jgi:glycosyltransferase involved in cell wall biosynthesis
MILDWQDMFDGIGNSFGYSTHQEYILYAMQDQGLRLDKEAPIAFHVKPLVHYERQAGKKNIVFTMFEFEDIPERWRKVLPEIDVLIVPCEHNKKLFRKYTDIPIEVCLEGADVEQYRYIERSFPKDRPFRFYWFGVNNPRKGFVQLLMAWDKILEKWPQMTNRIELYMKSCNGKLEQVQKIGNIIFDNRTLTCNELEELAHNAHAYIFPTLGEGFGLTLVEAIATGLPAIYTNYSGPVDYMNETLGYPCNYELADLVTVERKNPADKLTELKTKGANINMTEMIANMMNIYNNYENDALVRGKKAAEMVREKLTWEISARNLLAIIGKYTKKWGIT